MLKFLIEQAGKAAQQVIVSAATKTGTPVDTYYVYDKEMEYTGMNAIVAPRLKDNDTIAADSLALRIPVELGDELATDQVTPGTMTDGSVCEPADGKYVVNANGHFKYRGAWTEAPFGVTMYKIERVS